MYNNEERRAILISLQDETAEITQLADSLNANVINTFIQHRNSPDVKTYVGSGKLKEIRDFIDDYQDVDLVIINGELRPSQWFILEKAFGVEVYDRIKLILMIFKSRAHRKEAQLQVRLAELEYEKPYVKELIHRARSGEHPGLMAGGEYQVDDYFEMMKKQMKHIKNKLQKIEKDRSIQRKHRHKTGFYLVSLAGYTNAGKSSLLNCLTNNEIAVRNQLFSTLSTTTRKIQTDKIPILLTDTVGFIQDLPAWIINAFHSTLEEIKKADVVILVADVSDPVDLLLKKIQTSLDELQYLEVVSPVILVLNKSDLIPSDKQDEIERRIDASSQFTSIHHLFLSVKTGNGVQTLLGDLIDLLPNLVHITLQLPQSEEVLPFISWLYEKTYVLSVSYKKNIVISLKCSQQIMKIIDDFCKKHNGNIF